MFIDIEKPIGNSQKHLIRVWDLLTYQNQFINGEPRVDYLPGLKNRYVFFKMKNGENNKRFFGHPTYEDAVEKLLHGWKVGNALKEGIYGLKELSSAMKKKEFIYAPTGAIFDISKVLGNAPYPYITEVLSDETEVKRSKDNLVHISVNYTYYGNQSKEGVLLRGKMITSVIELLEMFGYRTRVSMWINIGATGGKMSNGVIVKDYNNYINYDRLAYFICHVGFSRVFDFISMELFPRKYHASFGVPTNYGYVIEECPRFPDEFWWKPVDIEFPMDVATYCGIGSFDYVKKFKGYISKYLKFDEILFNKVCEGYIKQVFNLEPILAEYK